MRGLAEAVENMLKAHGGGGQERSVHREKCWSGRLDQHSQDG